MRKDPLTLWQRLSCILTAAALAAGCALPALAETMPLTATPPDDFSARSRI